MSGRLIRNELSTQDTSTNISQNLIQEKRKHQIYKFLKSYVTDRGLKIFVHFEYKSEMSKVFKEVIEDKFGTRNGSQGQKRTEVDI